MSCHISSAQPVLICSYPMLKACVVRFCSGWKKDMLVFSRASMRSFLPLCAVVAWSCVTSGASGCFSRVVDALDMSNAFNISMSSR